MPSTSDHRSPDGRRSATFIVPGALETRTGGYGYDRRIVGGLRDLGWTVTVREIPNTFPFPSPVDRASAAEALRAVSDGGLAIVDGLAFGAVPDEAERESRRLRLVALVHHPLALETGLAAGAVAALEASERRALAAARAVVVTSGATARVLPSYGVTPDRVTVVEPGTDAAPVARGSAGTPGAAVKMLCVATLTPRKGHALLIRALASVPQRNWTLTCAGGDFDRATSAQLKAMIEDSGLADRVRLVGDRDSVALAADYDEADLFVLPTLYEGYGMAVAEALARGLPVISTATGAIEDLVVGADDDPRPPAGLIVQPGDLNMLTGALARVLGDADLRARLAEGARIARERLPRWEESAAKMSGLLECVAAS